MNRTLPFIVAPVLSIAAPAAAGAATRYVSPAGANNTDCDTTPCLTINYAVGQADSGDEIRLAAGTYTEQVLLVTKKLSFVGAGRNATIWQGPANSVDPTLTPGAGGSLRALTIVGSPAGELPQPHGGLPAVNFSVSTGARDLTIDDAVLRGGPAAATAYFPGVGLNANTPGTGTAQVTVRQSRIERGTPNTNTSGDAVFLSGAGVVASFADSELFATPGSGPGPIALFARDGAHVTVERSTLTGTLAAQTSNGVALTVRRSRLLGRAYGLRITHSDETIPNAVTELRDSVITSTLPGTPGGGVRASASNGASTTIRLTGSTLFAQAGASGGVLAEEGSRVELRNAAVRSVAMADPLALDLVADGGTITGANSAFSTSRAANGGVAPAPGSPTNVAGDPGFVNTALFDFTPLANSILIDRGNSAFVTPGELDLAGRPRSIDGNASCSAEPDIGALEALIPAPAIDRCSNRAPALSGVSLLRKKFTVKKPRHRGRKRGTRIRFTLSEAAKVKLSFALKSKGRKVKVKGKTRCVKPTRKNRRKKRCTRYVSKGSFTVNGKAGKNDLAFAGKVGKRTLKPGSYRLTLQATDTGGLKSAKRTLAFRILRP